MKIVIVGGVAGGATAAARIRRLDEKAEIVIFERTGFISYANCGLPYFKVFHTTEQTEDELKLIVDLGGTVADVFVWHKAYGKMEAKLNISSRAQIEQFIESVRTGKSVELMHITGGFHYHTVRANSEEILDKIGAALEKRNYIAPGI